MGTMTFAGLARRRVLCILHSVYAFMHAHYHCAVRLWDSVREELEAFRGILPLLQSSWTAQWAELVSASDAGPPGWAAWRSLTVDGRSLMLQPSGEYSGGVATRCQEPRRPGTMLSETRASKGSTSSVRSVLTSRAGSEGLTSPRCQPGFSRRQGGRLQNSTRGRSRRTS